LIKTGVNGFTHLLRIFKQEIDPDMEFILSGNGVSPYQEREQWTDGCNLVTIRPGVALTYDRNPHTEDAFRSAGYSILKAEEFLRKAESDNSLRRPCKKQYHITE
jgi:arginine deiminase